MAIIFIFSDRTVLLSLLRAETIYTFDGRYGTGEKEEGQAAK